MRYFCLAAILAAGTVSTASATTPDPPLQPRPVTGFSTIQQQWVYGEPGEGRISFPMTHNIGAADEVFLRTPEMCEGGGWAQIDYSKSAGTVVVQMWFEGLPYRMDFTRDIDVSTAYNQIQTTVTDGRWQPWIVGRQFNKPHTFWYDSSLKLIGSTQDLGGEPPPPGAFPVEIEALHMLGPPMFEGTPDGHGYVKYEFDYEQMLDDAGNGGVIVASLPPDLCKPDELITWYQNGGVPPEEAMSFDEFLYSIHNGDGIAIALTLEAYPKPEWQVSRDNTMLGFGGGYPLSLPKGYIINPVSGALVYDDSCGPSAVYQYYPKGYFDICSL